MTEFPPDRTSALRRLHDFLPRAGRAYAAERNHDPGPGKPRHVSGLSPYIRHRVLSDEEVLASVLNAHSLTAAQKFIDEVFWRTHWKGWLEMRPSVWRDYQRGLLVELDNIQSQSGLRTRWEAACKGDTDIDCFNAWAGELVTTGYLHNHARMWFASIWIFTLRLPWQLGADFFLRHLLDGDPASNTLSWRWVAGLQTQGKTYLARPDNIAKYSGGRFFPSAGSLASYAEPLEGPPHPDRRALPPQPPFDTTRPCAILLHEDDLDPGWILAKGIEPIAGATLAPRTRYTPLAMAPRVLEFREALARDAAERWKARLGPFRYSVENLANFVAYAKDMGAKQIVTAYAPVGPVADALSDIVDLPIVQLMRPSDQRAWPHATGGFFKFRKAIPDLLAELR